MSCWNHRKDSWRSLTFTSQRLERRVGRPFESLRPSPCSSTSTGAPLEFSLWRSKRRTGRPKRIGGDATAILQAAHWCLLKLLRAPIYHHLSVTFQQSHMAYLREFSHNYGISILKTHWTKWAIANSWNSKRTIRNILFIFHSYSIHMPLKKHHFWEWNPHFTIQSYSIHIPNPMIYYLIFIFHTYSIPIPRPITIQSRQHRPVDHTLMSSAEGLSLPARASWWPLVVRTDAAGVLGFTVGFTWWFPGWLMMMVMMMVNYDGNIYV